LDGVRTLQMSPVGQAGVWDRILDALAAGHDAAGQMIDTSVVRVRIWLRASESATWSFHSRS